MRLGQFVEDAMRGRDDIALIADRNDKATPTLADLHDGDAGGADVSEALIKPS